MFLRVVRRLALSSGLLFSLSAKCADPVPRMAQTPTWLLSQAVPSITVASSESTTAFGFEWEATPLLYSFGMTRLVSPWHSFYVVPTERFSGSVELVASGVIFMKRVEGSVFGGSVQLLGHIPLLERGERLGANVGVAEYWIGGTPSVFVVAGISTLFGLVHFNARYSPSREMWMGTMEMRLF